LLILRLSWTRRASASIPVSDSAGGDDEFGSYSSWFTVRFRSDPGEPGGEEEVDLLFSPSAIGERGTEMRDGSEKRSGERIGEEVKLGFWEADIFEIRIGEKTCFNFLFSFLPHLFLLFIPPFLRFYYILSLV
jgi:hypothetical protein